MTHVDEVGRSLKHVEGRAIVPPLAVWNIVCLDGRSVALDFCSTTVTLLKSLKSILVGSEVVVPRDLFL